MTSSILLRPPQLAFPAPSPSPSPSPVSTPLPALQPDLSSSSSSSTSESYLDRHRPPSARSTRRIRFAPLPEPDRDLLVPYDLSFDAPQSDTKHATQPVPPHDLHDGVLGLFPTTSPDSTICSTHSTPTIRPSPDTPSNNTQKSGLKLLRRFSFSRRADSSNDSKSPVPQSAHLPGLRNTFFSSRSRSSGSVSNTSSFQSPKLPRISTDDILSFGRKSFFRARSGSVNSTPSPRTSSPPPKRSDPFKPYLRSPSTGSSSAVKPVDGKHDQGEGSSQSHDSATITGSGPRKRRASTSATATAPGAGGGRHPSSVQMLPEDLPARPSTAPSSPLVPQKRHVKMLNGRVYGAKRYAAQMLANPFANVREEPEFVEWGYGGMGSVDASAGIGSDMWRGLQRSERGGALLTGSALPSASGDPTSGTSGGRGSGARATTPTARRRMSDNVPECGMGNVSAGGGGTDEDDGSGIAWLKKRRAEREAKARAEQEAKELERQVQEKRKSGDSLDASMYASTASTTTSLIACTSAASTDLTTPTTSPLASRPPSVTDLNSTSSPSSQSRDLGAVTGEQSSKSVSANPGPASKDGREHHVLAAVRLSFNISSSSRKHEQPVDTQTITSTNSSDDEPSRGSDEEEEQDDVEHEVQDAKRKTALGAGVEKISRHVDVEVR